MTLWLGLVAVANARAAPDSWDWRAKGIVSPPGDYPGSEGVWVAKQVVEAAAAKSSGQWVEFSVAALSDCTVCELVDACRVSEVLETISSQGGSVMTQKDYPASLGKCGFDKSKAVPAMTSWSEQINSITEDELADLIYKSGPVAAMIDASVISFQLYDGGVYDEPSCSSKALDHVLQIIGWGTDDATGKPYWILENSWGTSWGEGGYMRMVRGKGMCGINALVTSVTG
jgi:hypothetical protein